MKTRVVGRGFGSSGFTLVELLVVVAVIALLVGVLLPALAAARQSGQNLKCQNNLRSWGQAFAIYAVENGGDFPMNNYVPPASSANPAPKPWYWFDEKTIAPYLDESFATGERETENRRATVGGEIITCPNQPEGGRSYSMNYWASGNAEPGSAGEPFDTNSGSFPTKLFLMTEGWGWFEENSVAAGGEPRYYTSSTIGRNGEPGERFGGGSGVNDRPNPAALPGRGGSGYPDFTGAPTSYVPYYRHPPRSDDTVAIEGGANFVFMDGHVSQKSPEDMVDVDEGTTTLDVMWSPEDIRFGVSGSAGP